MKRKRTFMLLALLLVMVASGIMYAAVNGKNLVVNGYAHAKADDSNFNVKFVPMTTESTVEVNADGYFDNSIEGNSATIVDDTHATFNVVFDKKGTTYLLLKILNDSESLDANVTITTTVNEVEKQDVTTSANFSDYFTVGDIFLSNDLTTETHGLVTTLNLADADSDIDIEHSQYGYVKIPITLTKDVINDVGYDGESLTNEYSVTVTLHATPLEN